MVLEQQCVLLVQSQAEQAHLRPCLLAQREPVRLLGRHCQALGGYGQQQRHRLVVVCSTLDVVHTARPDSLPGEDTNAPIPSPLIELLGLDFGGLFLLIK